MTGIDWRSTGTTVTPAFDRPGASFPGDLTYRGDQVRLGRPPTPEPGDRVVGGAEAPEHYFALLAHHAGAAVVAPSVLAVPGWYADDEAAVSRLPEVLAEARLPVARVVAAPVAAAAYAQLTGALEAGLPVLVADLDGDRSAVTVLHAEPGRLRPDDIWLPAPGGDRAEKIGASVALAAVAAGLGRSQLRVLVVGDPDLRDAVVAATGRRHGRPVVAVELRDPAVAVAAGAAAIAAGALVLTDSYFLGVQLPVYAIRDGMLTDYWIDLPEPGVGSVGPLGSLGSVGPLGAEEIELDGSPVPVRLVAAGRAPRAVDVPVNVSGTYRVGVEVGEDGLALTFHRPGSAPARFPIPVAEAQP